MPIGSGLGWLIILMAMLTAGCDSLCSSCAAADKGIAASNTESQGPTVEVRGRSDDATHVYNLVTVHVTVGDVTVIAVESAEVNHVRIIAEGVMLSDNLAERHLISDSVTFDPGTGVETIEVAPGDGVQARTNTEVYVRQGAQVEVVADSGNVEVVGSVGKVKATARDGAIAVRGATQDLDLETHGNNHGITVNGSHGQLILHADNGSIAITAQDVNVTATSGIGSILFVGNLLSGTNVFSTTGESDVTVVMPRNQNYAISARTSRRTIDIQFPMITSGYGSPACGTFVSGPPYVIRADDRDHQQRGQVTLNMGDIRSAGSVELIGVVTDKNFAFHSTARNVLVEMPNVSEFYIETLKNTGVTTDTAQLTQAEQEELLRQFEQSGQTAPPSPSTGDVTVPPVSGYPMHPIRCPFTAVIPPQSGVAVKAMSSGGHIRIYQNLPGLPQ